MKKTTIAFFILMMLITVKSITAQDRLNNFSVGIKKSIYSNCLDENRNVFICLPESYDEENREYPVLYLLDGEFLPVYLEAVSASSYLHYFEDSSEFIIVGISTVRKRDKYFIPTDSINSNQNDVTKFQKFLLTELISNVNSNYRTTDFKVLYGGSNAGLFAIYTLLNKPDSFDAIIASSPSIGYCPALLKKISDFFVQNKSNENKIIYLNHGEKDSYRTTEYTPQFYKQLKNKLPSDYPIKFEIIKNQGHVPFGSIFEGLKYVLSNSDL